MQESVIFTVERDMGVKISDEKVGILKFSYILNNVVFKGQYDLPDIIHRINNQKRLLNFLLSGENFQFEEEYAKLSDGLEKTIFLNSYLNIKMLPEAYLQDILTDRQLKDLAYAYADNFDTQYLLSKIGKKKILSHIGYMYVRTVRSVTKLRDITLNRKLPVPYRLHSLLKLSRMEDNIYSLSSKMTAAYGLKSDEVHMPANVVADILIRSNLLSQIAESGILDGKIELTGNNYLDSLEAEMLFTAAAVSLHEQYLDIDLFEFLEQLKYTFVREGNTEFVVAYNGSDEPEYVRIAIDDNYIDSIKNFVESIYKRNKSDKTEGQDGGFERIVKGPLFLIKTIRKL